MSGLSRLLFVVVVLLSLGGVISQPTYTVPAPTGNSTIDYNNIQSALSQAQSWQSKQPLGADGLPPQVQVYLSAGTYSLCPYTYGPVRTSARCLTFTSWTNLLFSGSTTATTKLELLSPDSGGILVERSQQVTIANLLFDYQTPPFNQGTVVAVNQTKSGALTYIDVQIDPGYLSFSDPLFVYAASPTEGFLMIMDPTQPRVKRNVPNFIRLSATTAPYIVSGTTWRLTCGGPGSPYWGWTPTETPLISVGDRWVYVSRIGANHGLQFDMSTAVTAANMTFYGAGALTTVCTESTGPILFENLHVLIAPNTTRLISSNADGTHLQNNRGPITISGAIYQGMADDAIAVYSVAFNIDIILSTGQSGTFVAVSPRRILIGDQMQIIDGNTGAIRGLQIVANVTPATCSTSDGRNCTVTLDTLPIGTQVGDSIYIYNAAGSPFTVSNSLFLSHRGHGILLCSPDSLIEGNNFTDINSGGVMTGPFFAGFNQGPVPNNVTIRGNSFSGGDVSGGQLVGGSDGWWDATLLDNDPQVIVTSVLYNLSNPTLQINAVEGPSNILIISNQFFLPATLSIEVDVAQNVEILYNEITTSGSTPRIPGPAVLVMAGNNITISPLTLSGLGHNTTNAIELDCGISTIPDYQCWQITSDVSPITVCPSWPANVSTSVCPSSQSSPAAGISSFLSGLLSLKSTE